MNFIEEFKEKQAVIGISRAEISRKLDIPINTLEKWFLTNRLPPIWAQKLILKELETMKKF